MKVQPNEKSPQNCVSHLEQNVIHAKQFGPETRVQPRPALTTAKGTFAMASKPILTPSELRNLFDYNPETGVLLWRVDRGQRVKAGDIAGSINHDGYRKILVRPRVYLAHRVAWALVSDQWPDGEIDHINGLRDDNRIANLRVVSRSVNCRNMALRRTNTSGVSGVSWHRQRRKWHVRVPDGSGGKRHIGLFDTLEQAAAAREEAVRGMGFTQRHGCES